MLWAMRPRDDTIPAMKPWLLVVLCVLGGCDACDEDESAPIPEAPPPRPEVVRLPEVPWPPTFHGVPAPRGSWGDHQLALDPATDDVWLATFDSSDEGTVLLSRLTAEGMETAHLDLPRPMGGSFLRFVFDGTGEPHLMYLRVVGEVDTESHEAQLVHAFRAEGQWLSEVVHREPRELEHASSIGWLIVDGGGEVVFAYRRGHDAPTLLRRSGDGFESLSLGDEEVGQVLAFEVGGERTRFAWTDPVRSKLFLSSTDGPTRELHAFEDFTIRRRASAVFTPNGELHVVAEHHDNISFLHLLVDRNGIRRTSVAPFADGLALRPMVGFDELGALVTFARVDTDGSTGELWLARVERQRRPAGVQVAPLERDVDQDHVLLFFGPPIVDRQGRVFIGTKGWISGPGTVWTNL